MAYRGNRRSMIVAGILLIIIAGIIYLSKLKNIKFELWPLAMIFAGLFMLISDKPNVPRTTFVSTLLILLGSFFIFESLTSWKYSTKTWPAYILIPGISFLVQSIVEKRKGSLHVGIILTLVGLYFILTNFFTINFLIIILVLIGLFLILFGLFSPDKNNNYSDILNDEDNKEQKEGQN